MFNVESLFLSRLWQVGDGYVELSPMSLSELDSFYKMMRLMIRTMEVRGAASFSFFHLDKLTIALEVFLVQGIAIAELITGIDREELWEMPFDVVLDICSEALAINAESNKIMKDALLRFSARKKRGRQVQQQQKDTSSTEEVMQSLVSAGHSWADIQTYTLAEIGAFLRAVIRGDASRKVEALQVAWYGNNLSQDGLKRYVSEMQRAGGVDKEQQEESPEQIAKDWKRLAKFMGGLKNG